MNSGTATETAAPSGGYELPIERGKVREFAVATMAADASLLDDPSPLAPPTFLTTAATLWETADARARADVGFDLARLLHGEEEFVFPNGLPRAGDVLQVDVRIDDRQEKQGRRGGVMRLATIVREYRDGSGALVAEQRTTLIETAPRGAA